MSKKIAEIKDKKGKDLTQEEQSVVDLFDEINSGRLTEEEKLNHLLKLIIPEEQREVYLKKYSINKDLAENSTEFKSIKENISENTIDISKQKIFTKSVVNCKRQNVSKKKREENSKIKKHDLEEFHDVAINDRNEATNEVTRETTQGAKTEGELEQDDKKNLGEYND